MTQKPSEIQTKKEHGPGITAEGYYDGTWTYPEFGSSLKHFVEPGSNVTKLLMRALFKDERERNAAILLLRWVREYKLKNDEAMLLDWIAAGTSLKGLRMHQLLQAVVGQLDGHRPGLRRFIPGKKQEGSETEVPE